jgi:hypothetical protein
VARVAADHAHVIERTIEHALAAAQVLAALVRQGNGSVPDFESRRRNHAALLPGRVRAGAGA